MRDKIKNSRGNYVLFNVMFVDYSFYKDGIIILDRASFSVEMPEEDYITGIGVIHVYDDKGKLLAEVRSAETARDMFGSLRQPKAYYRRGKAIFEKENSIFSTEIDSTDIWIYSVYSAVQGDVEGILDKEEDIKKWIDGLKPSDFKENK